MAPILPNNPAPDLEWTDIALNGWGIYQRRGGLRFSIDAVLLAHFASARSGAHILDICTGTGIVALILAARFPGAHILGTDIQPQLVAAAQASGARNGIAPVTLDFATSDLRQRDACHQRRYDLITCNPPFFKIGHGASCPDDETALARHEHTCTLDDVFAFAAFALRERGRLALIHRTARLDEVLSVARAHKCKPVRLQPVYAREGEAAKLFLLECCYLGAQDLVLEEPLYIYDNAGCYRPTIQSWYNPSS
ncbi:MAG: methyltransferase [Peptococcaceae bacterium]|nr:methyltransferase [Peptococcaceae bacterium]